MKIGHGLWRVSQPKIGKSQKEEKAFATVDKTQLFEEVNTFFINELTSICAFLQYLKVVQFKGEKIHRTSGLRLRLNSLLRSNHHYKVIIKIRPFLGE